MKFHKIWCLLFYTVLLSILLSSARAQNNENQKANGSDVVATNPEENTNNNTENNNNVVDNNNNNSNNNVENNNNTNNNNNDNNNTNTNNNNTNNNGNNTNNNNNNNSNKNGDEEEEDDREYGSEVGNILFHKPNESSVVVPYSNFTVIWYYQDRQLPVIYPRNNITIMLFKNEDANYNDNINGWKNHLFSVTIPMSEVEPGPEIKELEGKPTYQWNWDTNFYVDKNFIQYPSLNTKFKLRIFGDGKDIVINKKNYPRYKNGDLTHGVTSAFYIVENKQLGNYNPSEFVIKNAGASVFKSTKVLTTIFVSVVASLFMLF